MLTEKERCRLRRRNNLTRVRENPAFRQKQKPGYKKDETPKHRNKWMEEVE